MKQIIFSSNPEYTNLEYRNEYDLFREVYYKGEPFTGIICDGEQLTEQTEYRDGNAHGEYVVKYKSGKIHTLAKFEEGEQIQSKSYYESGNILECEDQKEYRVWSENGQLAYELDLIEIVHKSYFNNGQLKSISKNNTTEYYSRNGDLVMIFPPDKYIDGHYVREINYKDHVLIENYSELLNKDFHELEKLNQTYQSSENHYRHLIWMWFWQVFDKDLNLYFTIVNNLMKHPDREVISEIANIIAIHRFEPYIDKENVENALCYALIKEKREYQDRNFPDRDYKRVNL